jgi:hemerythrin
MGFTWGDDLATGIAEIDAQHRVLIKQFNELLDACAEKKGGEELGRFLTFLTGYVHRHFDDEERVMAEASYSGVERHRGEHERYRRKLAQLKEDLAREGRADKVISDALWMAAEWFLDHIRQVDMAMAAALRANARHGSARTSCQKDKDSSADFAD